MPKTTISEVPGTPASDSHEPPKSAEKRWHLDEASAAAPVIRANMISLRVSYKGRVQVAFFDNAPQEA
jgi:hypothetical protein